MDTGTRSLIVNADDFGRSREINSGVIKAREHGILTSASLMVRWPAATEAAAYGRDNSGFSLGLHVDLGEWAFGDGEWFPVYETHGRGGETCGAGRSHSRCRHLNRHAPARTRSFGRI